MEMFKIFVKLYSALSFCFMTYKMSYDMVGYVVRMGEVRNARRFQIGRFEGKRLLEVSRHGWV
jgi:hypothetical protein